MVKSMTMCTASPCTSGWLPSRLQHLAAAKRPSGLAQFVSSIVLGLASGAKTFQQDAPTCSIQSRAYSEYTQLTPINKISSSNS
jgi:hypothetical protein